jgi:hypothetical protein
MAEASEVVDAIWRVESDDSIRRQRSDDFKYYFQYYQQIVSPFKSRAADGDDYNERI